MRHSPASRSWEASPTYRQTLERRCAGQACGGTEKPSSSAMPLGNVTPSAVVSDGLAAEVGGIGGVPPPCASADKGHVPMSPARVSAKTGNVGQQGLAGPAREESEITHLPATSIPPPRWLACQEPEHMRVGNGPLTPRGRASPSCCSVLPLSHDTSKASTRLLGQARLAA